jgi:hypothetical protein
VNSIGTRDDGNPDPASIGLSYDAHVITQDGGVKRLEALAEY